MRPTTSDEFQQRATLPIGSVLRGKYRIDGVLGVGGMAVVYAATHRNTKRFAIKVLHSELAVRRDVRARFVREGYVANSVDHRGVVEVLDDDVSEDGSAFLVMELLDGASVEALLRVNGRFPAAVALAIGQQLLEVLAAAHERGIVHRDIKPGNLFLSRDGTLKVLDFGIARLRDATSSLSSTRSGATMGTPGFMAPEQALAEPEEVDARTDIWAVGATLFNLLSGELIHPGENGRKVMLRTATQPARSLAQALPNASDALVTLVDGALAFDRSARWESAATMQRALLDANRQICGREELQSLVSVVANFNEQLGNSPTEPSSSEAPAPIATHIGFTRPPERSEVSKLPKSAFGWRWPVIAVTLSLAGLAAWIATEHPVGRRDAMVGPVTSSPYASQQRQELTPQVAATPAPLVSDPGVPKVSPVLKRDAARPTRLSTRAPSSAVPLASVPSILPKPAPPPVPADPLDLPIQ